jgi:hypothetical protein
MLLVILEVYWVDEVDEVYWVDEVDEVYWVDEVDEVYWVDEVDEVYWVDEVDEVYWVDKVDEVYWVDEVDEVYWVDEVDEVDKKGYRGVHHVINFINFINLINFINFINLINPISPYPLRPQKQVVQTLAIGVGEGAQVVAVVLFGAVGKAQKEVALVPLLGGRLHKAQAVALHLERIARDEVFYLAEQAADGRFGAQFPEAVGLDVEPFFLHSKLIVSGFAKLVAWLRRAEHEGLRLFAIDELADALRPFGLIVFGKMLFQRPVEARAVRLVAGHDLVKLAARKLRRRHVHRPRIGFDAVRFDHQIRVHGGQQHRQSVAAQHLAAIEREFRAGAFHTKTHHCGAALEPKPMPLVRCLKQFFLAATANKAVRKPIDRDHQTNQ